MLVGSLLALPLVPPEQPLCAWRTLSEGEGPSTAPGWVDPPCPTPPCPQALAFKVLSGLLPARWTSRCVARGLSSGRGPGWAPFWCQWAGRPFGPPRAEPSAFPGEHSSRWGPGIADGVQATDSIHPRDTCLHHCWLELPGQLQRLPASLERWLGTQASFTARPSRRNSARSQSHLPLDTSCRLGLSQALETHSPPLTHCPL